MGFREYLYSLKSYEPGKPVELVARDYGVMPNDIIKLASNENPLGTSKKAIKAIQRESKNAHRYPDDSFFELKDAIAKKYMVNDDNIIVGQGSDQIIELLVKSVCDKGSRILTSALTFAMYGIYASHNEVEIVTTKYGIHNANDFIDAYNVHKPSLIFLCVPNNPLGDCLDSSDVYRILDSVSKETIVALDCAYGEFASYRDMYKEIRPLDIVNRYSNCIYLGTFSKLYGLGGLRVGYGIANTSFISLLSRLRPPFNVTNISAKAATQALFDFKFVNKTLRNNFREMERYEKFALINNIDFIKSYTNFITFTFTDSVSSTSLCEFLLKHGIIIRDLKSYGINAVRITIGTKQQNKAVLKMIDRYLKR